jgi:hypothetical protein
MLIVIFTIKVYFPITIIIIYRLPQTFADTLL